MKKIIILLLSLLVMLLVSCSKKTETIFNEFNNDKESAIEMYDSSSNRSKKKVDNLIIEHIDSTIESLKVKGLDNDKDKSIDEVLKYSGVSGVKNNRLDAITLISALYDSESAYNYGEELYKEKDYSSALSCYESIHEQSPYYEEVQEKLKECILIYSEEQYKEAEEIRAIKGDYSDGIAIRFYKRVDKTSPYYEDAQKKIEICAKPKEQEVQPLEPYIGMLESEVQNCAWGMPQKINETINKYGTSKQYVYSIDRYLYFENGVLTTIQQWFNPKD